jgi:hypothetical protein
MSEFHEAGYNQVMYHLKHAFQSMNEFMALSGDVIDKAAVRGSFRTLRDTVRRFAREQYHMKPKRRGSATSRPIP